MLELIVMVCGIQSGELHCAEVNYGPEPVDRCAPYGILREAILTKALTEAGFTSAEALHICKAIEGTPA